MPKVSVLNNKGEKVQEIELNKNIFGINLNASIFFLSKYIYAP